MIVFRMYLSQHPQSFFIYKQTGLDNEDRNSTSCHYKLKQGHVKIKVLTIGFFLFVACKFPFYQRVYFSLERQQSDRN